MSVKTGFICAEWHMTDEGREVMMSIVHRNRRKKRSFGLLERPVRPPVMSADEYEYKVFVSGKSGVGKSAAVANLCGSDIPTVHSETPGIQTSIVYWPAKIVDINRVVMFKLHFWDAGENALKKFDHVLPACKERVDAVVLMFSFADKSSFEDIPHQMSRILEPHDNVCKFVMGTKLDLQDRCEVTHRDVHEFEVNWKLPVLTVNNAPMSAVSEHISDVDQITINMNYMCDELWRRDQLLAAGHTINSAALPYY
ncbi:Ciliogenesis and planar polarity effector 2 [Lamellibrachia satsuma]|nr:Ciliogenesis and planar polarity effector 2 [Lamellibrachia satsuma]